MIIPSSPNKTGGAERQLIILKKKLKIKNCEIFTLSNNKNKNKYFFLCKIIFYILYNYNKIDLIHNHTINFPSFISCMIGKIFFIPSIIKITRNGKDSAVEIYHSNIFGRIYLFFLNLLADKFICLNSYAKKDLLRKKFSKYKLVVIPNGVEIINVKTKQNINNYITVGRLIKRKGIDAIIKIFKKTFKKKNKRLYVIGDGPEYNKLRTLDKRIISNSQVIFCKNKNNFFVQKKMSKSYFFLMNSNSEGLSNALLEAMAHKLVIVAKNIKSNVDILKNNFNCFVFNNENELNKILKRKFNTNILKKIKQNAFITIKTKFDINIIVLSYTKLYEKLINKKNI